MTRSKQGNRKLNQEEKKIRSVMNIQSGHTKTVAGVFLGFINIRSLAQTENENAKIISMLYFFIMLHLNKQNMQFIIA